MRKITLSAIAATVVATSLSASTITLYQDVDTGAIYTKPGANRVELGDFISAKDVYIQNQKMKTEMSKSLKGVTIKSGVPTLKFDGTHYLQYHYHSDDYNSSKDESTFETTRNYFQVKAYWNKKDYARLTLDTHQEDNGSWIVRLKYGYLYLSDILPYTGVEFGQVHRPWIDYAEHHGWLNRPVSETFPEGTAHVINSAGPGINFKTKTDYFSSEIGLFNDEGYHGVKSGSGQSFEWRLTAHVLGTGRQHVHATKDEWLNISYFGRYLTGTDAGLNEDTLNGIHAVYNNPMFLIGGYWMKNLAEQNHKVYKKDGDGWSVNGEFRPIDKFSIFARYDNWNVTKDGDDDQHKDYNKKKTIYGVAYKYNKHVRFLASGISYDPNDKIANNDQTDYMLTAEVKW